MHHRFVLVLRLCLLLVLVGGATLHPQSSARALTTLTVEPLTWNVIGLDSNNVSVGPNHFPIGARICNEGGEQATNVTATFVWDDGGNLYNGDPYINLRPGTLSTINLGTLNSGACATNYLDAYFEVAVTRNAGAYDHTREYHIDVTAGNVNGTISTPRPRELYVEHLISQSRNTVSDMKYGTSLGSLASVANGGTLNLMVGNTYYIQLVGSTATQGYEQIETFINFPNTVFQVLSVDTTYSADTSAVLTPPYDQLYGDACVWENDPNSPNYRACLSTGKAGGNITVTYQVKIVQVPGAPLVNPQPLSTLIYDFSGSSFHYNADFGVSTRYANIINASISKSFSPKTITPGGTSTLTFTINNPGAAAMSSVNFTDDLPTGMTLANNSVASSGCGGALPATVSDPMSFSNITVAGLSTCTVAVTVTAASNGTYNNTSGNLFIGTTNTGSTASDTLVVSSQPTPPASCTTPSTLATWNFNGLTTGANSGPFTGTLVAGDVSGALAKYGAGTGSSSGIANSTSNTFPGDPNGFVNPVTQTPDSNSWGIHNGWPSAGVPTGATTPYFQFQINAFNYGGVSISAAANLQGNWTNGDFWYVLTSPDETTWTQRGTGAWANNSYKTAWGTVSNNTSKPSNTATTYFRVYFVGAGSKTDETVFLDNLTITGCPNPPAPTISKSFGTDPLAVGASSQLTFTITNNGTNATNLTGLSFTDVLPGGLELLSPAVSNTCGGTLTLDTTTDSIELSGGTLNASNSCTIVVNVQGGASGAYTNTTTNVTSTQTGPNTSTTPNVGFGQDTITVIAPPVLAKSFSANPIFTGNNTSLDFDITNTNTSSALTGVSFTDVLPAGLSVLDGTFSVCGGTNNLTTTAATRTIALLNSTTIAAGGTCSFSVTVTGSTAGSYTNTTGNVSSSNGGTGNTATANVLVKTPAPAINLLKQVGPTATGPWTSFLTAAAGSNVYYRFTVENTGDVSLANVSVEDPMDPMVVSTAACSWKQGDSATPVLSPFDLPLADADNNHIATCVLGPITAVSGLHTNTAEASGTSGSTVTKSSSATYGTPEITIAKSVTQTSFSAAGDVLDYSYLVTNSGDAPLLGPVTVTDDKTTVSCPAVTTIPDNDAWFDVGESLTCTATYTVLADDVTAGFVTNTAYATVSGITSNNDSVTVYAPFDLAITKTNGVTSVNAGGTTTYTIRATNNGPTTIAGAILSDPAVIGLSKTAVVCSATPGQCATAPTVTELEGGAFALPSLAIGEFYEISVTASVTAASGSVTNTATIAGPAGATDSDPSNNSAIDTDTVTPVADLVITKSDSAATINTGGVTTYTIRVTNNGPSNVSGAVLSDPAVTGLTKTGVVCSATPGACSVAPTVAELEGGSFLLPDMASGQFHEITVTATVTATSGTVTNNAIVIPPTGTINSGTSCVTASGITRSFDAVSGACTSSDTNNVTPIIDLSLDKQADLTTPNVGGTVEFTLQLSNTGPSTATNIVVTDVVPTGYTYVTSSIAGGTARNDGSPAGTGLTWTINSLASGASTSLTYQATVLGSGIYDNYAEITSHTETDSDSTPGNGQQTPDEDDDATETVTPLTTATIGDLIWNDLDGDGVQDGGLEVGLENVRVYVDVNGDDTYNTGEPTAITNASGTYAIPGIAAGTYAVRVDTSTLAIYGPTYDLDGIATSNEATVTVTAGQVRTDVDFGYQQQNATISNFVWNDLDGDGVQDGGLEVGLNNVRVYIDRDNDNAYDVDEPSALTAGGGIYSIDNLAAGTYAVRVDTSTVSGYVQTYDLDGIASNHEATVTLTAGQTRTDVDFGYRQQLIDVSLVKQVSDLTPNIGEDVTFTLTVANAGPTTATTVVVTDVVPSGYLYIIPSITGGTLRNANNPATTGLTWTISSLASGASTTLTYQARVLGSGVYDNYAQITSHTQTDSDSTPGDASTTQDDDDTVVVTPSTVSMSVNKTSSAGGTSYPGGQITYTINIENTLTVPMTDIVVTDAVPAGTTFVSGTVNGYRILNDYRDDFSSSSYTLSTGTVNWSTNPWIEPGGDGLPTAGGSGTIGIFAGELYFDDPNGISIERTIGNLSGKAAVYLDIDIRTPSGWDATDAYTVDIWDGAAWQTVSTRSGSFGDPPADTLIDISAYANADTRIRIDTTNVGNGGENENLFVNYVRIYYAEAYSGALPHAPGSIIQSGDHYSLAASDGVPGSGPDFMTITYVVDVDAAPAVSQINNSVAVTSAQIPTPVTDSTSDNLSQPGSLVIVKNSIPNTAQDFAYTVSGTGLTAFSLDDDADGTLPNTQTFNGLAANATYSVAETAATGWDVTNISCTGATNSTVTIGAAGGFDPGDTDVSVQLASGETVTCTFDNTAVLSILTTKTANDTSIPETGQSVVYTVEVQNTSPVSVTLNSLTDDKFNNITTTGHDNVTATTCATGGTINAGATYSCTFTATVSGSFPGTHVNIVTAQVGDGNSTVSDGDNETITFEDVLPSITVTKTANPTSVVETGGNVIFTYQVQNTGAVPVTITSLGDNRFPISGDADCQAGTALAVGDSCSFEYSTSLSGTAGTTHTNIFTAHAQDGNAIDANDTDNAAVTFSDVLPAITVTKTANPTSVPETGGNVTFTYQVQNTGTVPVTITSLDDDVFGALIGDADCELGTVLAPNASCDFAVNKTLNEAAGATHTNIFTAEAEDSDGNADTDTDDAGVTFTDVLPAITVTKTANPTSVVETGDSVTFTYQVHNTGTVPVTITSLGDNRFGALAGDADCQVNTVLAANAICDFTSSHTLSGAAGTTHTNIFTAATVDSDGNTASDSDDATVTFNAAAPATIGDSVFLDDGSGGGIAGNGIQDGGEGGIAGLTIYVDIDGSGTLNVGDLSDITDGSGSYSISNIPAGTYDVRVSNPPAGYTLTTANDPANITLTPGETDNTVDFGYIAPRADLELDKSVSNSTPLVATNITFTLSATNQGPDATTNVEVTDLLPSGFAYSSDNGAGAYDDATGVWAVGDLAVGQTKTLTITVTVNSSGSYTNYAQVTASSLADLDSTPNNNSDNEDDDDSVTVTPANSVPTATDNEGSVDATTPTHSSNMVTTDEGHGVDSDPDADPLTVTQVGTEANPANDVAGTYGSLNWSADGSYTYTLNTSDPDYIALAAGAVVTDTFPYTISDGNGGTATANVIITITKIVGPDAVDDTDTTAPSTPVVTQVLTNDDLGTTPTEITSFTQPSHGSVTCTAANCTYTPNIGFSGTDTYTYTITDDNDLTDTATVTITVGNIFDPPFGLKTFNAAGLPVLRWTMVWINNSNTTAINVQVTDPISTGTTFLGNLVCTPTGVSTTTLCQYDSVNNQVIWRGSLGPDDGATNAGNANNEVLISFDVTLGSGVTSVQNAATSDYDGNGDGDLLDTPEQNVFTVSSTWSATQPPTTSTTSLLPATGFAPHVVTDLSNIPQQAYTATGDVTIEIPSLGVKIPVVGVPKKNGTWNVSWLSNQAGWLEGTAFPSWSGNSVLTSHVYLANGLPGPFVNLGKLKHGDKVVIHAYGQKYTFEVRENKIVEPDDKTVIKHEEKSWLTLITCKEYDPVTNTYRKRVVVRAVLVSVDWE